ncbi:MAG: FAD:protein FMN transferase [Verrucomicrobia bacterium]|nr:FAD:protein FMN transferase [Verrucomicrobiota bacterium]
MQTITLARHAMATRFELVLHGEDPVALRAAGEEALDEIDRLENQLSLYRAGSEIAQLNARAASESVRVTPELFALLQHAQRLHAETGGVFDITIAPLVRCWGFMGGSGKMPTLEEIAEAQSKVGMSHIHLDAPSRTVRFDRPGGMLDLGAIGKGYAVERAVGFLRDAGVTCALVHGGTSTVYAMGRPPDADCWQVAIEQPPASFQILVSSPATGLGSTAGKSSSALPAVRLRDEAMSVSAAWGRCFEADGQMLGHVLDPRTGHPADRALLAVVVLPSATETDALATAMLTAGREGFETMTNLRPNMRTLLLLPGKDGLRVQSRDLATDLSK